MSEEAGRVGDDEEEEAYKVKLTIAVQVVRLEAPLHLGLSDGVTCHP